MADRDVPAVGHSNDVVHRNSAGEGGEVAVDDGDTVGRQPPDRSLELRWK